MRLVRPAQAFAVSFDDGELGLRSCFSLSARDDAQRAGSTGAPARPPSAPIARLPAMRRLHRAVSFLSRSLHKTYLAEIHMSNIFI
nr:hypothetical protein [Burkholderia pseudomallei]